MTSFFSAEGGPIWIKFRRLVQNDRSTALMRSKSKPDVEFKYGGRLGEFNGMLSQSHLPQCRVLPPGEFNVMIPEIRVTLQGAATGRIQWHFIPEPRITLQGAATWWIHCHDSRATYHIAGCTHLAKSISWSCRIAGCKNFIRNINKKLSCRRETARRFVSLNILLSHSRPLKVIRNDTVEKGVCKSPLVFHWNYVCMLYRLWDIQRQKNA